MEDIPPMGAMIMFNLEDGVLCLAVVTEVSSRTWEMCASFNVLMEIWLFFGLFGAFSYLISGDARCE